MSLIRALYEANQRHAGNPIPVMVYDGKGVMMFSVGPRLFGVTPDGQVLEHSDYVIHMMGQNSSPQSGGPEPLIVSTEGMSDSIVMSQG